MTHAQLMRTVSTRSGLTRAVVPLGTPEGQGIVKAIFLLLFLNKRTQFVFICLIALFQYPYHHVVETSQQTFQLRFGLELNLTTEMFTLRSEN